MNLISFGKRLSLLTLLLFSTLLLRAQTAVISGTITDANDKETLPFVNITFPGTIEGAVRSKTDGTYSISNPKGHSQIRFSFVGYKDVVLPIEPGKSQHINVTMQPVVSQLNQVDISSTRNGRYRNRDNPAVELIRKVIANKDKNRPENYNYIEYREYDKMLFALNNVSNTLVDKKFFRKYKFVLDNRDSTTIPGKSLLPVFLTEKLSQYYYRKNPEDEKTIVLGKKDVDYGAAIDNDGIESYLKNMYAKVDIYDNDIFIITHNLRSPIADDAPTWYKFFITDTITTEKNQKLVELSFTPRNTADLLFEGKIYITLDGNYAVEKDKLGVNKDINLNYVKTMTIEQSFEQNPDGHYHLSKSNIIADFGINKKKNGGFFGIRTITYGNYIVDQPHPDTTYTIKSAETELSDEVKNRSDQFWAKNRLDTLTTAESKVYKNIDSLKDMPSFKRTVDIATLILAGYKSFNTFEVGPSNTFYSFNPIEGLKLRLGGRTTPELSKRYYFETYAAYGFKDERWKYFLSGTYSINDKSIYKFPQNYIRASFQRDTKIPGLNLQFVQQDNFLLSFKRGVNDKYLYNDFYRLDYVHEYENHFSYSLGFHNLKQAPAGSLYFNNVFGNTPSITTTEASLNLRYAPNEKFYQGKIYRIPIAGKYPIISLDYIAGLKNVFGGDYGYQSIHLRLDKRVYLSQFGFADVTLEGGKIFGQVPYPLLNIFAANQTYAYSLYSYNLMNFLEFVADHYATVNIDQHFMGFFFNKIPLFKKLKWREVVSFKGAWGGVSDLNNPSLHSNLYQFPVTGTGQPITYALGSTPYLEGSIGVENIFKLIRVDLVRRFNYLDHPEVSKMGIRVRLKFDF
ncbi:MAG: DUF5686 family protein [Mucilaginibacter sp.]